MSIPLDLKSDVEQTCRELKSLQRKISQTTKMEVLSRYTTIFLIIVSVTYFFNPIQIFPDNRPMTNIAFIVMAIGSGLLCLERGSVAKSLLTHSFKLEDKYLEHGIVVDENGLTVYRTDQKGDLHQAFDPFDPASYR